MGQKERNTPRFTVGEMEKMENLIQSGVTRGSLQAYRGHWNKWINFLGTIPATRRPDEYMEKEKGREEKVRWLVLFVAYLYDVIGIRGSKKVSQVLSALRLFWHSKMLGSDFFDDSALTAAKKGGRHTLAEAKNEVERREATQKLPAFLEMVLAMRRELWEETDYGAEGLYKKAIWLAAAFSFDMGLRPSNVRKKDGPKREDHCILARHIAFRVRSGSEELSMTGGESIRSFLVTNFADNVKKVMGVDVLVPTTKTHNRSSTPLRRKSIGRGNVLEERMLEDLCEFQVISGVREDDAFCTRYAVSPSGVIKSKTVTSKDLNKAVKRACEVFDLPSTNFSSKSLRSGFASHMTSCGISREDMMVRAGWSHKSRIPEQHYIFGFECGVFGVAMGDDGRVAGLGVDGTRRLLPPGTVSISSRAEV